VYIVYVRYCLSFPECMRPRFRIFLLKLAGEECKLRFQIRWLNLNNTLNIFLYQVTVAST
jgi:hypothetical protein